jgi:ribosomal-protein-alanine N-acetyltransferase
MIRLATQEDVPRLSELEDALFPENAFGVGTLRRELEHSECWVVGEPIHAYAIVRPDPFLHDLLRIGVENSHQGSGVGSALLRHVLEQHPGEWMLTVWKNNPRARRLYQRFGFHLHGYLPEAWVMRRREREAHD